MKSLLTRLGSVGTVVAIFVLVIFVLRGPQSMPALNGKRREIRDLQESNANLEREIQIKKQRLERLRHSQIEQDLEIRERLKLMKPGEKQFVLPDAGRQQ